MQTGPLRIFAMSLFAIDALLVIVYLTLANGYVLSAWLSLFFNLDRESTIASWFSSTQLALARVVFALRALQKEANSVAGVSFYTLWAVALMFLSADEAAGFHESISRFLVGVLVAAEEFLEMIGISTILVAALKLCELRVGTKVVA